VEVADEELVARPLQLGRVLRVHGAGEPELGVVRDTQRVVVVLRADDRQHRAEDLLLRDLRRGRHVVEHGGLHEPAGLAGHAAAAQQQLALPLAGLDVAQDALMARSLATGPRYVPYCAGSPWLTSFTIAGISLATNASCTESTTIA